MDKLSEAIKHRAKQGDPKAMMALATTNEEALKAIEMLVGPTFPVQIIASNVPSTLSHAVVMREAGVVTLHGYIQNLAKRQELAASFQLVMTAESAKQLANALLRALHGEVVAVTDSGSIVDGTE